MTRNFTLEYWLENGWYVGRLKDVPGVFSQAETFDELVKNIEEVYRLMLEETIPPAPEESEIVEIGIEV